MNGPPQEKQPSNDVTHHPTVQDMLHVRQMETSRTPVSSTGAMMDDVELMVPDDDDRKVDDHAKDVVVDLSSLSKSASSTTTTAASPREKNTNHNDTEEQDTELTTIHSAPRPYHNKNAYDIVSIRFPPEGIKTTTSTTTPKPHHSPPDVVKPPSNNVKPHTVFTLEVKLESGLRWNVEKRFRDFRELHESLKKLGFSVVLKFPKRHLFGSHTLELRRQELEQYCLEVLRLAAKGPSTRLRVSSFFEVSAHVESYERKIQRKRKFETSQRLQGLLRLDHRRACAAAFHTLVDARSSGSSSSIQSSSLKKSKHFLSIMQESIFRRDVVLSVFPECPANFITRFLRVCPIVPTEIQTLTGNSLSNHHHPSSPGTHLNVHYHGRGYVVQPRGLTLDALLRTMAICIHGSFSDKLQLVFHMADLDHASRLTSSACLELLSVIHGHDIVVRDVNVKHWLHRHVFDRSTHSRLNVSEFVSKLHEVLDSGSGRSSF